MDCVSAEGRGVFREFEAAVYAVGCDLGGYVWFAIWRLKCES